MDICVGSTLSPQLRLSLKHNLKFRLNRIDTMLYSITSVYCALRENAEDIRKSLRTEHFDRLITLKNDGRLFAAGPQLSTDNQNSDEPSILGSLIIAEFDSLSSAQNWAAGDPYAEAGIYSNIDVYLFKKILP